MRRVAGSGDITWRTARPPYLRTSPVDVQAAPREALPNMADETAKYGWTTLPADQSKDEPATPTPAAVNVVDLQPPDTPLAQHIAKYAKSKLP